MIQAPLPFILLSFVSHQSLRDVESAIHRGGTLSETRFPSQRRIITRHIHYPAAVDMISVYDRTFRQARHETFSLMWHITLPLARYEECHIQRQIQMARLTLEH